MSDLRLVQSIHAIPAVVYHYFTNATALREWLCDTASTDPRPGGRFYLAWNSGYYAAGEFVQLNPDREVGIIWHGRDEPQPSRVHISLHQEGEVTRVNLTHSGLGSGSEWETSLKEIERGWKSGLKNLVAVLEDGGDLRIIRRPMIGILFGEYTPDPEHPGPDEAGLRIEGVLDGMGAQLAGLQRGDIITEIEDKPVRNIPSVLNVMQHRQAGDQVSVSFFRDGQRRKLAMTLSHRPIPVLPRDAAGLSEMARKNFAETMLALNEVLAGVSTRASRYRPSKEEWSINETLAHLIHTERDTHDWINQNYYHQERVSDGFGDNLMARVRATAKVCGDRPKTLLKFLQLTQEETVQILAALPDDFFQRKATVWRLAFQLYQIPLHYREHLEQIQANLAALGGGR